LATTGISEIIRVCLGAEWAWYDGTEEAGALFSLEHAEHGSRRAVLVEARQRRQALCYALGSFNYLSACPNERFGGRDKVFFIAISPFFFVIPCICFFVW
jgi:hypothetical protein